MSKSLKNHIDNVKTIADKKATPGEKARAATEEIADGADRAGRPNDAKHAREGGKKAAEGLDLINEVQNSPEPYAGSKSFFDNLNP